MISPDSAQLMTAGADQQLIASKLEETDDIGEASTVASASTDTSQGESSESSNTLDISHDPNETLEQMDKRVKAAEQKEAAGVAENALSEQAKTEKPADEVSIAESGDITNAYALDPADQATEPSLGGTLNATTEQAAEDNRNEIENDQNKTLLSHSYVGTDADTSSPTAPPSADPGHEFLGKAATPGSASVNAIPVPQAGELVHSAYADEPEPPTTSEPATPSVEPTPAPMTPPAPADLGLPMPPALPDFSQLPPAPAPSFGASGPQPEILGDILAPEPSAPPTTQPSQPTITPSVLPPMPQPNPTNPNDPGQFKIPGQQ